MPEISIKTSSKFLTGIYCTYRDIPEPLYLFNLKNTTTMFHKKRHPGIHVIARITMEDKPPPGKQLRHYNYRIPAPTFCNNIHLQVIPQIIYATTPTPIRSVTFVLSFSVAKQYVEPISLVFSDWMVKWPSYATDSIASRSPNYSPRVLMKHCNSNAPPISFPENKMSTKS